ncbi:MAG TPA: PKD domain-containing protein, partial [Methanoregulaceae archaeon]|nr:PKD domain-containing protein [Methanoregulaceae archaeon]
MECVTQPDPGDLNKTFASFPLIFIRNAGQFPEDFLYMVISDAGPISFGNNGSELIMTSPGTVEPARSGYRFDGADGECLVEGVDPLACEANFFYGRDSSQWVTGVDTYRAIRYTDLYPGIDLLYEGVSDGLKSTYFVDPGADPGQIGLSYYGQDEISVADDGTLVLSSVNGTITHSAPYCYQVIDGSVVVVSCDYAITDQGNVTFTVGDYDRSLELVIDPVLQYSLYLKNVGMRDANSVALDSMRNAYVTGVTYETPYAVPINTVDANAGGTDVVVIKINSGGTAPVYIAYLGGSEDDSGWGIKVDSSGSAYVVGTTGSPDFPVENALQPNLAGQNDAFIAKLAPDGQSLVYSTYMGGTGDDYGYAIDLDGANNAYMTGSIGSSTFPVPATLQRTTRHGLSDGFLMKISSTGDELLDREFIGGYIRETGYGIAVDGSGNAYIAGLTYSPDFPVTVDAFQPTWGGNSDGFVTKIAPSGDPFVYSTYLGGTEIDNCRAIDIDSEGYAYVTGQSQKSTFGTNFPTTPDAFKPVNPGGISSYYTRIDPSGSTLAYSTFITGLRLDEGRGISVTPSGSVYITGITKNTHLETINAIQPTYGGDPEDAFVAKFVNGEPIPEYLTYLGGDNKDEGHAAVADGECGVYVVGWTRSTDFPTSDPYPDPFLPRGEEAGFISLIWDYPDCCTPPTAAFDADPDSGYAPLTVQFTDLSTYNPATWVWEFGDGATSTAQNPSHTYQEIGTYTVTLTVSNECGSDSTSAPINAICLEPVANFTADPDSGYAPLTVQFTDNSENNVNSWLWDFGDETTSEEQNPTHTFTGIGEYTVTLTVWNDCGTDSTSAPITTSCLEPVAAFTADPTSGYAPLTVQFTDNSENNVNAWLWDFGDGTTSDEQNPTHTFTGIGEYTVELTVWNDCGTDSTYAPITTSCLEPVAAFTADPTSGYAPLTVQFTDNSENNVNAWSWDFGDGATSDEQNPTHTFTGIGEYTVELTVWNDCGTDSTTAPITTNCLQPVAAFTAEPDSGYAPLTVQFTDNSENNVNAWFWEFGDGATSEEQNPTHTFEEVGSYTVELTVWNDCGTDSTTAPINAICLEPVAQFTADPDSGYAPLTVQFTDSSLNNVISWNWNFGDGSTSTQQNPVHTFDEVGTYTVTLTVQNDCGSDSTAAPINAICLEPVAAFTADPTSGYAPLTVQFTDNSENNVDTWLWNFGDGTTSEEQNP